MNKSNQKLLVKNYIYNTVYNVLAIVLPMVSIPYVTRRLSPDALGTYNYTQSIVYFFVLFGTLGMSMFSQREIAYYREDEKKRNNVFWELLLIRGGSVGVILIAYLFFAFLIGEYTVLYIIQVLDILAAMLDITWFFQGQEDFKKPVVRNIIIKVSILVLTFLCIKGEADLYTYVFIHSILQFAGNVSLWGFCKGKIKKCCWNELHPLKYLKGIIILFIPQLVVQIYATIAKPMLGIFTDTAQVAYYEQALKIIKIVTTLITAVGTVMLPRMSKEFQKNNKEEIRLYMNHSYQIVALIGYPLMIGLMTVANKMVNWFYGKEYAPVGQLIVLLSPIIIVSGISTLTSMQFLVPSKRQKEYTISIVCGSVVNVILNILLIPRYAAVGAAIASVISELLVLICQVILTRKEVNIIASIWHAKKYLLHSLIMGGTVYLITNPMKATMVTTMIQGVVGVLIYLMLLLVTKDQYINQIVLSVKRKFDKSSI